MEVEPEMIPLLGRLEYPDHMLNPWSRLLRGELAHLELGPRTRVLDPACGIGGVAVMVAREFGARVRGYDVLADHVENAVAYARAEGQGASCEFSAADVRDVVGEARGYDALLWIAAPRVWRGAAATIGALRRCVRPGGTVFIADAYRGEEIPETLCPGVQTLEETTEGLSAAGDTVTLVPDPPTDWEGDTEVARAAARRLLGRLDDPVEQRIVERYIAQLDASGEQDAVELGSAFWHVVRRADGAR